MTVYQDEIEVRRPAVSTKVLVLACAILAVLGSFWGIVWFIRAYVEPPRVMMPAPMALASRESTPVRLPPVIPVRAAEQAAEETQAAPVQAALASTAQATPAIQPAAPATRSAAVRPRETADASSASNAVADRWAPINQFAAPSPAAPTADPDPGVSAPAPSESAPAALATGTESDIEEVAEGSVPAIQGPAPLPRRKPAMTASFKRNDPPLPRPRPDGAAPQSVWNAVPSSDDRYPGQ
jgi:cytoskeletal protein RodZ